MNIGILTFHSVYNFGANLQTLSTVYYLKNNGYRPIVIDWRPSDVYQSYLKNTPDVQKECHELFFKSNYPLSRVCYSDTDIISVIEEEQISAIIIGSDAVWSYVPKLHMLKPSFLLKRYKVLSVEKLGNAFWGSFYQKIANGIPLIMISASAQNSKYKGSIFFERMQGSKLMKQFSYISVRDSWTKKMVEYFMNDKTCPDITPDPVFGFNYNVPQNLYSKNILERFNLPDKYILMSFIHFHSPDKLWMSQFSKLATEKGYTCIGLPFPQFSSSYGLNSLIELPLSPIEWYALIINSQGYVGNNMHPIVVCLHNAIPFYSFDNYGFFDRLTKKVDLNSSKIFDLLNRCGYIDSYVNIVNGIQNFPAPSVVFDALVSTNRDNAIKLSQQKVHEYVSMMKNVELSLNTSL